MVFDEIIIGVDSDTCYRDCKYIKNKNRNKKVVRSRNLHGSMRRIAQSSSGKLANVKCR